MHVPERETERCPGAHAGPQPRLKDSLGNLHRASVRRPFAWEAKILGPDYNLTFYRLSCS